MSKTTNIEHYTGLTKKEALNVLESTPSLSRRDVLHIVKTMRKTIDPDKVDKVKFGDVFWQKGLKHPSLVIKTSKSKVWSLLMTSHDIPSSVAKCNSRFYKGFVTTALNINTQEEASSNFLGVFDNKKEVSKIKKQFKNLINGI